MPPPRAAAPQPLSPLLLRHISTLRAPLFAFLPPRDVVTLLATCRSLRNDHETVAYALANTSDAIQYVLRDCLSEWHETETEEDDYDACASVSSECSGPLQAKLCPCSIFRENNAGRGCRHFAPLATTLASATAAFPDELSSPARCASLLSLATVMATEMESQLYESLTPVVTSYTIVPFILPLARQQAIAQAHPPPGQPSVLGCHLQNCVVTDEEVHCALCAGAVAAIDGCREYQERRWKEEADLRQELHDDGLGNATPEALARWAAFNANREATDELYGHPDGDSNSPQALAETLLRWGTAEKLEPLQLLGDAEEDDIEEALHAGFYDENYGRGSFSFCRKRLQSLVAFFHRNGCGPIHRTMVTVEGGCGTWEDEIRSVEMVGASAPHGFFVGVYFVATYT